MYKDKIKPGSLSETYYKRKSICELTEALLGPYNVTMYNLNKVGTIKLIKEHQGIYKRIKK